MSETWRGPRGISLTFTRLVNPQQGHERVAQRMYGAKSVRDVDNGISLIHEAARAGSSKRPRVTGSLKDGIAFRNLAEALEREGIVTLDDEIEPDDLPTIFENNHPIRFRGAVPTRTIEAAAGTGATITFADACDTSGRLVITPGTTPSTGAYVTVTFAVPRQDANYGVLLSAADADAASAAGASRYSNFGDRTSASWKLAFATALVNGTSYHIDYLIVDRTML